MMHVATPFRASVRVPVVVLFASVRVSDVIAIESAVVLTFTIMTTVPTGKGTAEFAGMVSVMLVPFIKIDLAESDAISV